MTRRSQLKRLAGWLLGTSNPVRRSAAAMLAASGAAGAENKPRPQATATGFAPVVPGVALSFPADHGAHPRFRTEWWYVTGWLERPSGRPACGFQITFFRSRTGHDANNPSRFAPTQLILAHAALALPERGRLLHDQRGARQGFGLALADSGDTRVTLDDWTLTRDNDDRYHASLSSADFGFELVFQPPAAPVLQGEQGFSRKGPRVEQSSYYYSRPQLRVTGRLLPGQDRSDRRADASAQTVTGTAWLDHEWSSQVLDTNASGWDWCGLNFDDGSALMAFMIRDAKQQPMWSHSRWINRQQASGQVSAAIDDSRGAPLSDPRFEPQRWWRSTRTGIQYPVAMRLSVGSRQLELSPLFDDQELDSRGSTGAIYWEGAVTVTEAGRPIGRGYLELTGYGDKLRM